MTSYQKLKKENKKLKEIIDALIFRPDSADALHYKFNYKLVRDTENAIMAGSPTINQ